MRAMKAVLLVAFAIFTIASCAPQSLPRNCGCKYEDKPVCGTLSDGTRKDFENRCRAGCAGAHDIRAGPCPHHVSRGGVKLEWSRGGVCGCPPITDPVCGVMRGGKRRTFKNRCKAICEKARHIRPGPCHRHHDSSSSDSHDKDCHKHKHKHCDDSHEVPPPLPPLCGCPPFGDPVCALTRDGLWRDYANRCEASCEGATHVSDGACTSDQDPTTPPIRLCGCPPIEDPVCGKINGEDQDFSNQCQAGCADATDIRPGRCDAPIRLCGCLPIEDPVCGKVNGEDQDFVNQCEAGCAGATDVTRGRCGAPPVPPIRLCGCKPVDEPVCGKMLSGEERDFPNQCEAGCADATDIRAGSCADQVRPLCMCNKMLDPVCGTMADGSRREFSNPCMAECEHATDVTPGRCGAPPVPPIRLCGCKPVDEPVCGKINGEDQDFSNQCQAGCADATDIRPGRCDAPIRLCGCPPIEDPVCGKMQDGEERDFANQCEAGCADAVYTTPGRCSDDVNPPPCVCTLEYSPVCATLPDGSRQEFGNECSAECEQATDITPGRCSDDQPVPPIRLCGCPPIEDPVCGKVNGEDQDFNNQCEAGCAEATDIRYGSCEGDSLPPMKLCGCQPIDDPVCGTMADGTRQDFLNQCEAGCAEAEDITSGECPVEPPEPLIKKCGCAPLDEPVCGLMPGGEVKQFPNRCQAGCKGATSITDPPCDGAPQVEEAPVRKCGCPPINDPVCARVGEGGPLKTFINQCQAGCADASVEHEGECEESIGA